MQLGYNAGSMAAVAAQMEVAVDSMTTEVQRQLGIITQLTGGQEFQGGAGLAFKTNFEGWKAQMATKLIELQNMSAALNLAAGKVEDNESVIQSLMHTARGG